MKEKDKNTSSVAKQAEAAPTVETPSAPVEVKRDAESILKIVIAKMDKREAQMCAIFDSRIFDDIVMGYVAIAWKQNVGTLDSEYRDFVRCLDKAMRENAAQFALMTGEKFQTSGK